MSVIGKLGQTKDNSNKSLLAFIMNQLCTADPDLKERYS